ncbi:MAG TPA: hypothetical protein P5218_10945, partial [Planctomycetota bacterium]|nr:hypothetical protein [Planctomycetota bacterium]
MLWVAPLGAQEPAPAPSGYAQPALRPEEAEALQAFDLLKRQHDAALLHYHALLPSRKSEAKRREIFDRYYPKPEDWGPRFAEVNQRFPGTEGAAKGLVWVVNHVDSVELESRARRTLLQDHLSRPILAEICETLAQPDKREGLTDLEFLFEHSPSDWVKGNAVKGLCTADLAALRKSDTPILRERLEQHIGILRDRYGSQVMEGQPGSAWATRLARELRHLSLGQQFL